MVLSTEYSEAVNARYTFQPLWVSGFSSQSNCKQMSPNKLTRSQLSGFTPQLLEHCTGIAEVHGFESRWRHLKFSGLYKRQLL